MSVAEACAVEQHGDGARDDDDEEEDDDDDEDRGVGVCGRAPPSSPLVTVLNLAHAVAASRENGSE